ncbi:MAG: DUF4350 domain-containing protein [Microbacterium sp.]|uniref:DUF4350 domain-containing protein n=1 Tax=Microbacterium sp. TaxID=51671 RepID=UPI003BB0BC8F
MTLVDDDAALPSTAVRTRGRLRRVAGWALVALLVIVVALVALQVSATAPNAHGGLDPEGRNDSGTLALAEILRDQGVEVSVFRTRAEARAAVDDDDTTLVMSNPYTLSDEATLELIEPADRVVFLSTGTHLLRLLEIGETSSGSAGPTEADCSVEEFAAVGSIRPDRLFEPADGVEGCFGNAGGSAVLVDDRGDHRIAAVEGTKLFSNAYLAENGNAALALALLGQTERVVWYVPSFADSDLEGDAPQTLGTLTPGWVTPAILLLMIAGIAAAIWRGQRFGPLVAETLPVTVRASETMHGRARLTAKAADAPHAAEALREGSMRRLARRLGLTARAGVDEVADAAADRLRLPRGSLQELLGGPLPADDHGLIDLARRLSDLEASVEQSSHAVRRSE